MPDQQHQLTPVDADEVVAACAKRGLVNVAIQSVTQTGSTNADATALAKTTSQADQVSDIRVVVAATQTAGRGRLDRHWTDQGESSLSFSILRRVPEAIRPENWGWIPLLAGLAVATVARTHGADVKTKWPNDVIVEDPAHADSTGEAGAAQSGHASESAADSTGDSALGYRKLAGILSEAVSIASHPEFVVVGIGINLTGDDSDMPVSTAISVQSAGGTDLTRESILSEVLVEFDQLWRIWLAANESASTSGTTNASSTNANQQSAVADLIGRYEQLSSTIGAQVNVQGAAAVAVRGKATGIDARGQLLVTQEDGSTVAVNVGDVEHLR